MKVRIHDSKSLVNVMRRVKDEDQGRAVKTLLLMLLGKEQFKIYDNEL